MSWQENEMCFNCGTETPSKDYLRCIEGEVKRWRGCSRCGAPYTDLFREHYVRKQNILAFKARQACKAQEESS